MKVVIVGGGSAGTTCAFEMRKLNKDVEITILEKTHNMEYSPCAMPYVLSGEIKSFAEIVIFNEDDYKRNNINLLLGVEVKRINKETKKIYYSNKDDQEDNILYDKLVIATGSKPVFPIIKGLKEGSYETLKTIEDAKKISAKIKEGSKSVIIGSGIIGMELAIALVMKKEHVYLLEKRERMLPNILDNDMSSILEEYLNIDNLKIKKSIDIKEIVNNEIIFGDESIKYDQLYVCCGVIPSVDLARELGLEVNKGIVVDEYLNTSENDVYACGDCVESIEFNTNEKVLSQLGTTAVKQAQVIAQNILQEKLVFPNVLNNTISKINNVYVGTVGLIEERAKELNIKTISARYTVTVRAEYYCKEEKITIKIISDDRGKIIGSQIIGHREVVGRLDLMSLAIQKKMSIADFVNIETCYNPASAPIFDPLILTASILNKKIKILISNN